MKTEPSLNMFWSCALALTLAVVFGVPYVIWSWLEKKGLI